MLNRLLPLVALVFWPCYSYSESISPYFGITGNAAIGGYSWNMDNVFPEPPGLEVNGLFYSYTPDKLAEDEFKVTIGNEGVWSDTEDWTGTPGGIEVRKVIGLPNVPREAWGDGYIITEGDGTIDDATVIYSYKVDPCFDPQFDPNCPGYVAPVPVVIEIDPDSIYDATEDEAVVEATEETDEDQYKEDKVAEIDEEEEEENRELRLEKALAAVNDTELYAISFAQSQILLQINSAINITSYIAADIPGGNYKEDVQLIDTK